MSAYIPAAFAAGLAVLATAAPTILAAQRPAHPTPPRAAATAPATTRPVAVYRLTALDRRGLPSVVTVADSAGALVASYRGPGEPAARPMAVALRGRDLLLTARIPAGLLLLELFEQNRAEPDDVVGRWTLDERSGELYGRVREHAGATRQGR